MIRRSCCPGRTSRSISSGCTSQIRCAPRGRWRCCMSRSPTRWWPPAMRARRIRARGPRRTKRIVPARGCWTGGLVLPLATRRPWPPRRPRCLPISSPRSRPRHLPHWPTRRRRVSSLAARAFRSDIEAGQAIGRAVGERAVARGKADGSDRSWDGTGRLTGPGSWQPTPPGFFQQPVEPLAGTWRTWILASGDQYRPPAPPPYRSPAWEAELRGRAGGRGPAHARAGSGRAVLGGWSRERSRRPGCGSRSRAT